MMIFILALSLSHPPPACVIIRYDSLTGAYYGPVVPHGSIEIWCKEQR